MWNLFYEIGSSLNQEKAVDNVCAKLNVKSCSQLLEVIRKELKRYKERLQPKKNICPTVPSDYFVFDGIRLEPAEEAYDEEMDSPSIKKPFNLLTSRSKRTRTDEINNLLKDFVESEKKQFPDSTLTVTNLLGYLIHRNNYVNDKEMAATGTKVRLRKLVLGYDFFDMVFTQFEVY